MDIFTWKKNYICLLCDSIKFDLFKHLKLLAANKVQQVYAYFAISSVLDHLNIQYALNELSTFKSH